MSGKSNLIDIDVTIKHQTDKAWFVFSHFSGNEAWVAKSVSEVNLEKIGGIVILTMPESMAYEKGLI